jgi:hypothetical protein
VKPLTVKNSDKETFAFEAIPLNESFFTTVYVALLAIAGAAATTALLTETVTTTAASGSLMTWPGKITLLDLNPLTASKSLNFTFVLLAIPVNESFLTTTYVNPAVAVADDELVVFDFESASAPGTPTTPSMIAEHNDTASVLLIIFMLRFTGFCIGPVHEELE